MRKWVPKLWRWMNGDEQKEQMVTTNDNPKKMRGGYGLRERERCILVRD